jgi:uncharacterized protein (DUF2252 family)
VTLTDAPAAYLTAEQRREVGAAAAEAVPPSSHADWEPDTSRPDPVALLEEQNTSREPDLVPVRHGRMSASAFTFFRGAARIMAEDLARAQGSGLTVQLCGDAHLSNFGVFASPERRLVFDLNDFDETLPGPFEQDLKRLAASFAIAATNNGFEKGDRRSVVRSAVRSYREALAGFAQMPTMDVWYAHLSEDEIRETARSLRTSAKDAKALKRGEKNLAKARERDSLHALGKLAQPIGDEYRIVSQPPLVVPLRELADLHATSGQSAEEVVRSHYEAYHASLPDDRRALLERFKVVDVARKVVGVGSVGTRAFIVLLQGRDRDDPLFLQAKEATRSVLEHHLPASRYAPGERVVRGQRLMQAASDIFLGWSANAATGRHYYFRQLRDMKGSAVVEAMSPTVMTLYAQICGRTLARAHARSGDPVSLDAYVGGSGDFERAVTEFAVRYAHQNQRDYEAFLAAIDAGRLEARRDL